MGGSVPFEQTAMECCLKYVCQRLHESVHNVEPRLRTVRGLKKCFTINLVRLRVGRGFAASGGMRSLGCSSRPSA